MTTVRGGGGQSYRYKGMPSWQSRMFAEYGNGARKRGYAFELTIEQVGMLALLNCHYCGGPPAERKFGPRCHGVVNGLDRVDNTLGYTPSNTVPCCAMCNRMKSSLTAHEFVQHALRIAAHAE